MPFNQISLSIVFDIIGSSALISCFRDDIPEHSHASRMGGGRTFFGPDSLGGKEFLTPENDGQGGGLKAFYGEKWKFSKEK